MKTIISDERSPSIGIAPFKYYLTLYFLLLSVHNPLSSSSVLMIHPHKYYSNVNRHLSSLNSGGNQDPGLIPWGSNA